MTQQKIEQLCVTMSEVLRKRFPSCDNSNFTSPDPRHRILEAQRFAEFPSEQDNQARHVSAMLEHISAFCHDSDRADKIRRWLGFIQGWLATTTAGELDEQAECVADMLKRLPELSSRKGQAEATHLWIGFIQGWFCTNELMTLSELKILNMPSDAVYQGDRL